MKQINLTKGQIALVDDADFEYLNQFYWHTQKGKKTFYAKRTEGRKEVCMHREILGTTDPEILVDHIDTNGLNNQRYNLREATSSQSSCNRNPRINSTSNYKGVSFRPDSNKWRARVTKEGATINIGAFDTEEAAALAYNQFAIQMHGEFANLNQLKTA